MILFFSGTGNSRMVAERMAVLLGERAQDMACGLHPHLDEGESLGIVFPVYAWGVPRLVNRFLSSLQVGRRYVWLLMTCGDDMGYADRRMARVLHREADAAFSVQMPNTYVCLPGFDVDSPEVAEGKVRDTLARLEDIALRVRHRESCQELTRGCMAWMKTYMLGPLFNAFLVTDRYFRTTEACIHCGLCARSCPTHDIEMQGDHPVWLHQDCTGCLRCYHHCPAHAIEWGRFTAGKGQKGPLA